MSSGGGSQSSSTKVEYSPEEQAARNEVMRQATTLYHDGQNQQFAGAKPVGPSSATQNSWAAGQQAATQIGRQSQMATEANNFALSGAAMDPERNQYLQRAMMAATRPLEEQFTQAGGVLSTIRNGAVDNGVVGGSRQGIAEGIAARGLQDKVGDIRAGMANEAYYKGMDAQQNAVKNQAMLNMMYTQPSEILGQIGAAGEGYQQAQNNYKAGQIDWQNNRQLKHLQNYANIIYGNSNGTTTTTQSLPKQDNTAAIVGTLGTMGMMAMMM